MVKKIIDDQENKKEQRGQFDESYTQKGKWMKTNNLFTQSRKDFDATIWKCDVQQMKQYLAKRI